MAVQLDLLRKYVDYFFDLSLDELDSIKKFISEQRVEEGEMIISEGQRSNFMYFVISGVVKVHKTSAEGKEQVMNMATTGESLNDVSTFDGNPAAASMLAATPVILYKVRKKDMQVILEKHPQVALNALKVLASRVRRDSSLVRDLSFTHITGRLAKMLLKYFAEAKTDAWPRFTQQDMAAIVGTTREVINRSLRDMEERGAIRLERHGVVILNKDILEKMTESSS
jgi:CRP/FNR family cyclic AMP-dependent transcriptional regulator